MVVGYSTQMLPWPYLPGNAYQIPGVAGDGVAVEAGMIVTFSIFSRRAFCTFA
jgi:hypothetical protein